MVKLLIQGIMKQAAVHLFRIVVTGKILLQGKNDGPVICLQFDVLFPGLPERHLW